MPKIRKGVTIDLSGYNPTVLDRAVSLEIARSFVPLINPNEPTTILMAISNAFISSIAYSRKDFTPREIEQMKKSLSESIKRIEENDREEQKNES